MIMLQFMKAKNRHQDIYLDFKKLINVLPSFNFQKIINVSWTRPYIANFTKLSKIMEAQYY